MRHLVEVISETGSLAFNLQTMQRHTNEVEDFKEKSWCKGRSISIRLLCQLGVLGTNLI